MIIIKRIVLGLIASNVLMFGQVESLDPSIKNLIKKSGISESEINKAITKELRKSEMNSTENNLLNSANDIDESIIFEDIDKLEASNETVNDIKNEINLDNQQEIESLDSEATFATKKPTDLSGAYFGYDIFKNNPGVFDESNQEAIDPSYSIGPGDEIVIMVWGETEFQNTYIVSAQGYIFVDNLGQIFVNGLNLEKLESKLFKLLKKVYASLDPNNGDAKTFFDVSLGSLVLRPVRVFVLGQIDKPGAYEMKSSTSLFSSLFYFNGPSLSGSLRDIKLIRNNKVITSIDYYEYLINGKKSKNVKLQRDDVIYIPPIGKTVEVVGEIKRPRVYELKSSEKFIDLIELAGGLNPETYIKYAQVSRILSYEERDNSGMDKTLIDINLKDIISSKATFELYDKDVITFYRVSEDVSNVVSIAGPVSRPGAYELTAGMTLVDLINRADGLLPTSFTERVDVFRSERSNFDSFKSQSIITLNLDSVLTNKPSHNLLLKSNDEVVLYDKQNMFFKTDVSISGHVLNPGSKPFRKDMTVYDLVFLGGGFFNNDFLNKTYLPRADLVGKNEGVSGSFQVISFRLDSVLNKKGIADFSLEMGDEIIIYSNENILGQKSRTVTLTGFVKNPGEYPYYDNGTLRDYVFAGGGIKDNDYLKKLYKKRADIIRYSQGENSKRFIESINLEEFFKNADNNQNDFKIMPGDEIRLYSKEMFNQEQIVSIFGSVIAPGDYELKDGMTIKDLILDAGGVLSNVFSYRVDIARIDTNFKMTDNFVKIFTYNLDNNYDVFDLQAKTEENFIFLMPYDRISIRPDPYFSKPRIVSIEGFVKYPGNYEITKPEEFITEIINRAGGLLPEAYPMGSEMIRNEEKINLSFEKILKNPRSKENFFVMDGDVIIINAKSNTIKVLGEVHQPGTYKFNNRKKVMDYIELAGGFTRDAAKNETYVTHPNGESSRLSLSGLLRNPKVFDGSVITVVSKIETEPFSFTEYVTNLTSIWADLTQAYMLILLATRTN